MLGATLSPSIGRSVLKRSGFVVELLSLLSNPFRIAILHMLTLEKEIQPQELARRLGASQSGTSQHLAKLLAADMVHCRRVAQSKYYRMSGHARAMRVDVLVRRVFELVSRDAFPTK